MIFLLARLLLLSADKIPNYDIVRYAAHPFFLQGYTAMANGENTFFEKNKNLHRKLYKGYIGLNQILNLFCIHSIMFTRYWAGLSSISNIRLLPYH